MEGVIVIVVEAMAVVLGEASLVGRPSGNSRRRVEWIAVGSIEARWSELTCWWVLKQPLGISPVMPCTQPIEPSTSYIWHCT